MRKIGILTFHRSINYGAYMQCFSLAKRVQRECPDYEVEVIDYESKIMHDIYAPRFTLSCIKHPTLYPRLKKRYRSFSSVLHFLPLSKESFVFDGEDEAFSRYVSSRYDLVIVGSDAVWNWIKRGFPNPYLLSLNGGCKRVSYAASAYGMDMKHIGEVERRYFAQSLVGFSFIGVRDEYTKALVKYVCPEQETVFTCDPTVFLDMQEVLSELNHTVESYKAAMIERYRIPKGKTIIGVMETDKQIVQALKRKYGNDCYIICLYNHLQGADCSALDLNPLEWSLVFSLFDITITNYFHGTLLSLRNGTPVIAIDRTEFSENNEGKIHDVMRRMEMLDCFFDKTEETEGVLKQAEKILKNRTVYCERINEGIKNLRRSSDAFFEKLGELL